MTYLAEISAASALLSIQYRYSTSFILVLNNVKIDTYKIISFYSGRIVL